MLISQILIESLEKNASDIILTADCYPWIKIDWDVVYLDSYPKLDKDLIKKEIFSIMTQTQKDKLLSNYELDFSIDLKWYSRFRVNAFYQKNWFWLVFRPIKSVLPDFEKLWLSNQILDFTTRRNWLILVTWAVWTWKSTTLASLINHINKTRSKHIITIEDPIEFVFNNEKSIIEQREVWINTLSFENWLKYALRQASDVIMVWEMRDLDTFRLALRAAETGNLVFATLHTSGAARTISRVIDMFPADERDQIRQQLSESLVWVIWQDLVKRADKKWRVPSIEILVNNISIANMIRRWNTHQINSAIETWSQDWMVTMSKYLELLYNKWIITKEVFDDNFAALNLVKID